MRWSISSFCLLFSLSLTAQHFEAGISVGSSNYLGDLSANSSKVFTKESHFSGGIFARYNIHDFVSVKLAGNYGTLTGWDANASNPAIKERNLNFETAIYDVALTGEFNILGYQPYALSRVFSPYLFAGIAWYSSNPRTYFQDEMVELAPLGTEGQGLDGKEGFYQTSGFAIPFGIGVKYAINDTWNIGLELGARKTFTDYLDDVSGYYGSYTNILESRGELAANLSQRIWEYYGVEPFEVPAGTARGDNNSSDWYFLLGFSISYNFLDNGLVGSRGRNRRKAGCQKF